MRAKIYAFLPFTKIYQVSRLLCKSEFKRIIKLGQMITRERKDEMIEVTVPCTHKIQRLTSAWSWWGFFFHMASKPNIKLNSESSSMLAMSLLERYAGLLPKIGIEFEVTGFQDCNQWVHLLMILSRRERLRQVPLFREITIGFDSSSY